MLFRKHSGREELIYADPREKPVSVRRRGLRILMAVLSALLLVALVLAALYSSIGDSL